jgi:RimJ/RimL family protein N-acetyltransferase
MPPNHEMQTPRARLAGRYASLCQILETERLIIRPFRAEDAAAAFQWFGDGEVMRFTPTGPDGSLEETKSRLATYREHQAAHGFSKWLVQERRSGDAIGDSGLLVLPESGNIDLGFRFLKRFWGFGVASEVAAVWTRVAFTQLGLERLTAFAHPANVASLRVLEKVGFRRLSIERVMGMQAITLALNAGEYRDAGARQTRGWS